MPDERGICSDIGDIVHDLLIRPSGWELRLAREARPEAMTASEGPIGPNFAVKDVAGTCLASEVHKLAVTFRGGVRVDGDLGGEDPGQEPTTAVFWGKAAEDKTGLSIDIRVLHQYLPVVTAVSIRSPVHADFILTWKSASSLAPGNEFIHHRLTGSGEGYSGPPLFHHPRQYICVSSAAVSGPSSSDTLNPFCQARRW